MICPYCGSHLGRRDRCDRCGEEVGEFKKIFAISNKLYNSGLNKAKVRDLSGAIQDLTGALKLNKMNTDARNLLGLIYLEMGETVLALSEWVISKHFKPEKNVADYYISYIQEAPTRLDSLNQIIKKYNAALEYAKTDSNDLAIIALKKVISMNPHYIQALQLLALCYLKEKEYEKARKVLSRAAKIDVTNTTTLSYLDEIKAETGLGVIKGPDQPIEEHTAKDSVTDRDVIQPAAIYAEEKPNIMVWVNLILGILIGAFFVMLVIVPNIKKDAVQDDSGEIIVLNERIQKLEAEVGTKENEKDSLQQDIDELKYQLEVAQSAPAPVVEEKDITDYLKLYTALGYMLDGKTELATDLLFEINPANLEEKEALAAYEQVTAGIFAERALALYNEAYGEYDKKNYDTAIELFIKSMEMDPTNADPVYFLARAYQKRNNEGDKELAIQYYRLIVSNYSDSGKRYKDSVSRLNKLGVSITEE